LNPLLDYKNSIGIKTKIKNIEKVINDGAGFILLSDHGHPTFLATFFSFNFNKLMPNRNGFSVNDIRSLSNNYKFPVAVISVCSIADFDTNPNSISRELITMGESNSKY